MKLKLIAPQTSSMLRFSYFLLALIILSCGEIESKKSRQEQHESPESEQVAEAPVRTKTILFFGDSLTAGYGLEDTNDAFPAVVQSKIETVGLDYTVINSGVSGETSSGGLSRIEWVLNQKVDVFVLELGANDGLRGITLIETRKNLQAIIDTVRKTYPEAVIVMAGMQLPPNLGQDYTGEFKRMFEELAESNSLALIPFLLKDVGGVPELNLPDGIHPNVEGQIIVANNVWEVLEPLLKGK